MYVEKRQSIGIILLNQFTDKSSIFKISSHKNYARFCDHVVVIYVCGFVTFKLRS